MRRLSSSALRLKNPAGFAAMHLAVGIISGVLNSGGRATRVLLGMRKEGGEERKPASESSCRMMSPGWAGAKPKESGDRRSADDKIDNSERG